MLTYTLQKYNYTRTNTTVTGTDVTSGLSVLAESARLRKTIRIDQITKKQLKIHSNNRTLIYCQFNAKHTILYTGETDNCG